ncbi:EmrB/QacA subfamily drug resistance transporter [Melghiribacillus thermohalophilus]|uniref:EmrB/QacA subfamily drug resistance transporter n=1 Tax=Melghiribacillus thermohalophilus TaxID=1324956 RepID=A0A4R3MSJ5_9BACI|nr:MDR family MFS transporter [Melghiribacillus thermohalophilus]TCT18945.1 EmrB/QacA subfamily drug resistance transporter [Melghiribacillus thermohalophilus]
MSKLPAKWLVVISVLFGTFTVILNNSMLNPVLPHFMKIFQTDAVAASWVLTIFMVAMGVTMPITGYLGDKIGKKNVYLLGLTLFMAGSLSGALSQTLSMVILSRAIQGIAGGLMMPNSMALIFHAFPKNERGLAVGIYGIAAMVAPAVGPTIGGFIAEYLDWYFLFLFNIPFAIAGLLFSMKYLKETETKPDLSFDWKGFVLVFTGIGSVLLALGQIKTLDALYQMEHILLIGVGCISLIVFVLYERKQEQPLLHLSVFKVRTYTMSIVVTSAASIGLFSGIFLLPLLIQEVYGFSMVQTGIIFLPAALLSGLFMTLGGKILDVKGPKYVVPLGLMILALSSAVFGFVDMKTSFWFILFIHAVRGMGLGFGNMPATTAGMNAISDDLVAQGSAMNNVIRQMSSSIGIVFFSIYYEVRRGQLMLGDHLTLQEATLQAINESFLISAIVIALAVPASFLLKGVQEEEKVSKKGA